MTRIRLFRLSRLCSASRLLLLLRLIPPQPPLTTRTPAPTVLRACDTRPDMTEAASVVGDDIVGADGGKTGSGVSGPSGLRAALETMTFLVVVASVVSRGATPLAAGDDEAKDEGKEEGGEDDDGDAVSPRLKMRRLSADQRRLAVASLLS